MKKHPQNQRILMKDLKVGFFWLGVKKYLMYLERNQQDEIDNHERRRNGTLNKKYSKRIHTC